MFIQLFDPEFDPSPFIVRTFHQRTSVLEGWVVLRRWMKGAVIEREDGNHDDTIARWQ